MSPRPVPRLFQQFVPQHGYQLSLDPDVDQTRLSAAGQVFLSPTHTFGQVEANDSVASFFPGIEFPYLHRDFAASGSDAANLLAFVNSYGLLEPGIRTLEDTAQQQGILRAFAVQVDDSKTRARGVVWPPSPQGAGALIDAFNGVARAGCRVKIDGSTLARPTLVVIPTTLLSWMWMQFASEITEGLEYKKCALCGEAIEVRTLKQKRDLKYCSDRCRSAALRQRRREEPK